MNKKTITHTALLLLAICLVAGCQINDGFYPPIRESDVSARGMPPEYAAGYVDGYQSGLKQIIQKNLDRFLNDPKYKSGWEDGYRFGADRSRATQRAFQGY